MITLVCVLVLVALYTVSIALELKRAKLERQLRARKAERRRIRQQDPLRVRRRVIVNLRNGSAVAGVLWTRAGGKLVVKDAVLHENQQEVPVDGEIIIDRETVTFIQVPPARA